jgi:tetratricopeptide (TPR) repeat protein
MSRSAARRWALGALALSLVPAGAGAATGTTSTVVTGVELTPAVRQTLRQLNEHWLEWIVLKDRDQAAAAVKTMLDEAAQLGMQRLPDYAGGALTVAVQMAKKKDFERAGWALDAAEQLDPRQPETAFARSTVEALHGRYPQAVYHRLLAIPFLFLQPFERYLLLQSLLVWALALLAVVGALLVGLQMASNGSALFHDFASFVGGRLPRPVALVLAALALLWPVLLPHGLVWLILYWSVLLWGYATASERWVLIALWLLLGCGPLIVDGQRRQVAAALSPPAVALDNLAQRRLYGGLFSDLGLLRSQLPESVAVKQLIADLHRSLNQWDLARSLYAQVLDSEPKNTAALVDLGVYSFLKGEFSDAIEMFKKATEVDRRSAVGWFNLSQAYSESYVFEERDRAAAQARAIDNSQVSEWLDKQQRVVAVAGGLGRAPEIRRQLVARWSSREAQSVEAEPFRRGLSAFLSLSLVLLAGALHLARRPFGYSVQAFDIIERERLVPWLRALVPGLAAAEVGEGWKSFFGLLLPAALAMLPFVERIGYRIPWRYDPGNSASVYVAIAGLVLYFGLRLKRELQAAG